ncbi:MAG TPA: S1 RNA-binding domain-containing protein, partial [Pyrinomonadaceae bacterium]|nr:S1 RNA-binding domain-containing protein [Pyrinomonadaceae bacterium]
SFGAFVELGDNLEGLCHISELSDERVAKPEDAAELGKEMEFRILRIDSENKKIGLSARAAGHDEPIVETKVYTSEAKGGMASLGELADFGIASKADDKATDKAAEKVDAKVDEKVDEPADDEAGETADKETSEG